MWSWRCADSVPLGLRSGIIVVPLLLWLWRWVPLGLWLRSWWWCWWRVVRGLWVRVPLLLWWGVPLLLRSWLRLWLLPASIVSIVPVLLVVVVLLGRVVLWQGGVCGHWCRTDWKVVSGRLETVLTGHVADGTSLASGVYITVATPSGSVYV